MYSIFDHKYLIIKKNVYHRHIIFSQRCFKSDFECFFFTEMSNFRGKVIKLQLKTFNFL